MPLLRLPRSPVSASSGRRGSSPSWESPPPAVSRAWVSGSADASSHDARSHTDNISPPRGRRPPPSDGACQVIVRLTASSTRQTDWVVLTWSAPADASIRAAAASVRMNSRLQPDLDGHLGAGGSELGQEPVSLSLEVAGPGQQHPGESARGHVPAVGVRAAVSVVISVRCRSRCSGRSWRRARWSAVCRSVGRRGRVGIAVRCGNAGLRRSPSVGRGCPPCGSRRDRR